MRSVHFAPTIPFFKMSRDLQCSGSSYNTLRQAEVCAVFKFHLQYLKRNIAACSVQIGAEIAGLAILAE